MPEELPDSPQKKTRMLLTGATGYLGSAFLEAASEQYEIVTLGRRKVGAKATHPQQEPIPKIETKNEERQNKKPKTEQLDSAPALFYPCDISGIESFNTF